MLWGYLIWSDLPGPATLAGILLVVASGLYIIRREILRGRRIVPACRYVHGISGKARHIGQSRVSPTP